MNENIFVLSDSEVDRVGSLVNNYLAVFEDFSDVEFAKRLPTVGYQLPDRLVNFLNEFKYNPPEQGYCVIKNLKVEDNKIGPTPSHWQLRTNNDRCKDVVMTMCACSSVLGDMFGWLTQQDGRLVHDVLPIVGHEDEQLGSGSEQELCWHTEDAFHDLRGDYIMLMCLRNEDAIPTTIGRPDYSKLTERQIDILFEPNFTIKPDNSHKPENESESRMTDRLQRGAGYVDYAYQVMAERETRPTEVAILFGTKKNPYIRIDPYFMKQPSDPEHREAFEALVKLIDESLVEVSLSQGDCVIIDNYLAVHGRRPFKARFDGTDRWFKRLNVIRDIRRCNDVLESSLSRVIY